MKSFRCPHTHMVVSLAVSVTTHKIYSIQFNPGCYRTGLLSLLIPVLEAFADEAAAIGLEVNWDKTKVQALGTQQPDTDRDIGRAWAPGCSC